MIFSQKDENSPNFIKNRSLKSQEIKYEHGTNWFLYPHMASFMGSHEIEVLTKT
jgi:hypothetical protein